jgi:dTDP-glucose 4,6-dehydratase
MILVTGGAGFIGSNYLNKLYQIDPSQQVVCVDSLTYASNFAYLEPLINCGFIKFEHQDITNVDAVGNLFNKYKPTEIVHFAAESHVDNSIRDLTPFVSTNILGTINLLQASLQLDNFNKFVHVSTDEVYGSLELENSNSFKETNPYQTNSPYSASKAASDCFVRAFYKTYGVPAVITNCSNNYGPNQHAEKFIPTILNSALSDKPIPVYGSGENIRDWLYVEDHCDAINLVLDKGVPGERYNIGGGVEMSNISLVRMILHLINKPESLITYVTDRPGHDYRYSINCSKIEKELGYRPAYSLVEGLTRTIDWYSKQLKEIK